MDTIVWPHLAWFINEDGLPYLYRVEFQPTDFPGDDHVPHETFIEACHAAGLTDIDIENLVRMGYTS